jgi:hypothetical protein
MWAGGCEIVAHKPALSCAVSFFVFYLTTLSVSGHIASKNSLTWLIAQLSKLLLALASPLISVSGSRGTHGRIFLSHDSESRVNTLYEAKSRYCLRICLERVRKTMKILSQVRRISSLDSKRVPPEHKPGDLLPYVITKVTQSLMRYGTLTGYDS